MTQQRELIELVEKYAATVSGNDAGYGDASDADALLSEIRQRLASIPEWKEGTCCQHFYERGVADAEKRLASVAVVPADCVVVPKQMAAKAEQFVCTCHIATATAHGDDLPEAEAYQLLLAACGAAPLPTITPERLAEMEANERRYLWLRGEVEGPHVPMAQVVWKLNWNRAGSQWTNLADGKSLDEHCDKAIAAQEGGK